MITKRERVMAAIRGEPVDRLPVSFWMHNFAEEHSPRALVEETMRLYKLFNWDYLKPQSRATCFGEVFGTRIKSSVLRTVPYTITHYACRNADEFGALQPADASKGALGEQVDAMREIRRRVGPDVPIIATIFAPLMSAGFVVEGGRDAVHAMMRAHPEAAERGLAAMSKTFADFGRFCMEAGVDGIFYASNVATKPLMSAAECRRFQRPFDLPILEAVRDAPFNVMHVCGDDANFEEFADYPAPVFSWATTPGNPTLTEGRARTGRAILGGLPGKPQIGEMTEVALVAHLRRSIEEMGGRYLVLGPDCSINPGIADNLLAAVGRAIGALG